MRFIYRLRKNNICKNKLSLKIINDNNKNSNSCVVFKMFDNNFIEFWNKMVIHTQIRRCLVLLLLFFVKCIVVFSKHKNADACVFSHCITVIISEAAAEKKQQQQQQLHQKTMRLPCVQMLPNFCFKHMYFRLKRGFIAKENRR